MSLIDQLKSNLTSEVVSHIAKYIGSNEQSTMQAASAAIPALLQGISGASKNTDSASTIFQLIKSFFDNDAQSATLSPQSDLSKVASSGSNLLTSILGSNGLTSVINSVSSTSGLSGDASTKLIGALAPMVLGGLFKNSGDASILSSLLGGFSSLGANVGGAATNLAQNIGSGAKLAANEIGETAQEGGNLLKKILPLLLLALLGALLWMMFGKGCKNSSEGVDAATTIDSTTMNSTVEMPALDSAAMAAKALWESTLGKMTSLSLPGGLSINVPENGSEKQLVEFVNGGCKGDIKATWFNMDRLLFKTGSSELNEVSMDQIAALAEIMKAYPNCKLKVGGYTDNVGNPASNKKLSADRAASVLNAIVSKGIDATRLSSEGYGQEHPVCPANDTDECKAKNRRVAVRVDQCN